MPGLLQLQSSSRLSDIEEAHWGDGLLGGLLGGELGGLLGGLCGEGGGLLGLGLLGLGLLGGEKVLPRSNAGEFLHSTWAGL